MPIHGVYKGLLNGTYARGDGGFLYVKGDECVYMFAHELKNQDEARRALEVALEEDADKEFFFVLEERDNILHMLAYRKANIRHEIEEEIHSGMRPCLQQEGG
jgi:hypothetical protein